MKELSLIKPRKHLLICVNTKEAGDYCGQKISLDDYRELKQWTREHRPDIKLTKTLCLGHCSEGANIMLYPEGTLIGGITNREEIREFIANL